MNARNDKLVRAFISLLEGIDINATHTAGDTLLHLAACRVAPSDIEIAKAILLHPHVDINIRAHEGFMRCRMPWGGETPLSVAIEARNVEVVRMLLNREDVQTNIGNARGQVPVAIAARRSSKEIVQLLLNHKDVNINLGHGELALQLAVDARDSEYEGANDIVRMLATHGSLDVHAPTYHGSPVLVWAGTRGDPYLVELLLDREDTDVNITDPRGLTSLHKCVNLAHTKIPGWREVLKLLLSQKDIDVHVRNNDGKTPADIAKKRRISKFYKQLLSDTDAGRQNVSCSSASAVIGSPSKRCTIL